MMFIRFKLAYALVFLIPCLSLSTFADPGPFNGEHFKGQIAFSSDGNFNDEDDWGAFPVAAAILNAFGVTDKLVHVDYNNILPDNDPRFYREMTASVLGAAERFAIPDQVLFDCQQDLDGAVEDIARAINASSAENPLYYVLAGPMEVPYRGIVKSDPQKRQFVYCISHSGWNEGFSKNGQALFKHNKRDVIPSGINWIQIKDGNPELAHPGGPGKKSTPEQWALYHWLRDSADARLNWIFTRLEAEWRADISDSTMTWFLLTGDEDANLDKFKRLLDEHQAPAPAFPRTTIRLEAENFRNLNNCDIEFRNDRRVSKRICVKPVSAGAAKIETPFNEPYTTSTGRYDVEVRYFDEADGQAEFQLSINGAPQGDAWRATADDDAWHSQTIPGAKVKTGCAITVNVRGDAGERGKLDYVQLNLRD